MPMVDACILRTNPDPGEITTMPRSYRVGIIGSTGRGDYGHAVDMAFTKIPRVEIVAVADAHEQGREAAQKRTGATTAYSSYRDMLAREKCDLVAICPRWIDQHHDMLMAAAEAGCHVYMEKPFCRTLRECDEVIDQFQMRHLQLGIAHLTQYSPILDVVKSLIARGEIGDVLEIRSRGKEDRRGGGEDLWVLGSHLFGIMRTLGGGQPVLCRAEIRHGGELATAREIVPQGNEGLGPLLGDQLWARYTFGSGLTADFASRRNMGGNPTRFALQVYGSKGVIDMETGYLVPTTILRDSSWSPGRSGKTWEPITSAGIGQPEPIADRSYQAGHIAAINDLLDAIEQQRPTRCTIEDCRDITEMILAVFESHRVGQDVKLPLATKTHPLQLMAESAKG